MFNMALFEMAFIYLTVVLLFFNCDANKDITPKFELPKNTTLIHAPFPVNAAENIFDVDHCTEPTYNSPFGRFTVRCQDPLLDQYMEVPEPNISIVIKFENACDTVPESLFIVYLATLDPYDNNFVSWIQFMSNQFEQIIDDESGHSATYLKLSIPPIDLGYLHTSQCYHMGLDYCVPRADVIFIRNYNMPESPWSFEKVSIEINVAIWNSDTIRSHYEHVILEPCYSRIDQVALYQIGPRSGIFLKHPQYKSFTFGEFVRNWL